jgi:hypothetical protein
MDEVVLGIIGPAEGKGKGGVRWRGTVKRFALIFTTTRVIMIKLAGFRSIVAGGLDVFGPLGIFGQLYARARAKKLSDLMGRSLDELLESDKDNYTLPYSDIVKVEMKKGRLLGNTSIWISTETEKHIFALLKKEEFQHYVNIVSTALPDKTATS